MYEFSRPVADTHIQALLTAGAYDDLYSGFDKVRATEIECRQAAYNYLWRDEYRDPVRAEMQNYLVQIQQWISAAEQRDREGPSAARRKQGEREHALRVRELDLQEQELQVRLLEAKARLAALGQPVDDPSPAGPARTAGAGGRKNRGGQRARKPAQDQQ